MLALTQCNIRADRIYSPERTGHKSLGLLGLLLVLGILGVGIDTVELSVTVLSITFKKGLGLKGWYSTSNSSGNEQSVNCICTSLDREETLLLNCTCYFGNCTISFFL